MLENDNDDDNSIIFIEKYNEVIKEVIECVNSYKLWNSENIQNSIIKKINKSQISPPHLKNKNDETLIHLIIKEDKLESLELIAESHITLLGFSDRFLESFLSENNEGQTVLDICVKYNNKNIIKYIYEIVNKSTESNFRLK